MALQKGKIVLMGSGELTATMVEVHKELLKELNESPLAVFIDTPAGFQLNVDQLSQRAVEYFKSRVQHDMSVVSFKSNETITPYAAEKAFHTLREADFFLIGPGSPTYAVRQWQQTPIPEIITRRITEGACLVAASAAALTVGRFTLPVYEIYKVGEALHWIDGMDILGKFGFDFVVIPHWNNAEGGNHDTRFCYMGEPRFNALASNLPADVSILGLDEHTACIIDLAKEEIRIRGIGNVTLRRRESEMFFTKGECYPMGILYGEEAEKKWHKKSSPPITSDQAVHTDDAFWVRIHTIQSLFEKSLEMNDLEKATNALLELDGTIWKAQQELENTEFISQGRDILRNMIVLLGTSLSPAQRSTADSLAPVIEHLLSLRNQFRQDKKWKDADAIRDCLMGVNIVIEDTADGPRWRLNE
jgi:peptidase E